MARFPRLPFVAALAALSAWPAAAQSPEAFYKGRKMDMIIGYSSGGTYDLYARLMARFLANYIPGNPVIVPRNMPGGGSRTATAWVAAAAPKDGTVLATADQSLAIAQALGDPQIRFDVTKLIYIGNPSRENNTTAAWHTSGIRTIEDAMKQEVTVGATGGSTSSQYPKAMNAILGTKFKIILGYPGGNDINIALERGEVAVRGSNTWQSWKSTRADWLRDKKINILVQIGLSKADDLPDVPLLMDLAKNDNDRAVLKLLSAPTAIGRPIFTAPDTMPERVKVLRDAFDTMVADPKFQEEAKRENLEIDAVSGAEVQKIVAEIVAAPPQIAQRLNEVIGTVEQNTTSK
ncbi:MULTISPECIES: tripartite tricarboxylate transporter substrate-binding protein [unclassified Beijerinckia]|uniref:Bug family tripartite tricarboxylate transporter substrate binding protein n=1 Tax=unclassified Beijerinckia TaxID=2638183 RepID=UPI000894D1A8|nr:MULTISPECIES: tripartite tricarboxylate transporter substrate-binding protein [unclassified Beijerinckia]MDH7799575.1 tripartite-type tricarboxylate transporter receptor subunit TctC [Beijerinckia sp. GAS462]SEB46979.1 Tripartite-type tricarboxylate transporter, receptor component TctC [Beijerinckia sp. 28-YEA-48]